MKSLEELRKLRAELEKELAARNSEGKPKIIIGMGTCGIAAGAREILKLFCRNWKTQFGCYHNQTGCIGT